MAGVNVSIRITNLPQLKAAFNKAPNIVRPYLDQAIKKTILTIGRHSRELTPVDTGRLRASTREIFRPLYGEVGTHANYDIFVHEGTRFMKARPYLRNAVKETRSSVEGYFAEGLQKALNDIARLT